MMTREWKSKTLKARNWQRGRIEREKERERERERTGGCNWQSFFVGEGRWL